jgi:hypothetical protein
VIASHRIDGDRDLRQQTRTPYELPKAVLGEKGAILANVACAVRGAKIMAGGGHAIQHVRS